MLKISGEEFSKDASLCSRDLGLEMLSWEYLHVLDQ